MTEAEQICEFIRTNLVDKNVDVNPDTPFERLGLDSFSLIEIILFIEREFGITLPDTELNRENLFSAAALAGCLSRLSGK